MKRIPATALRDALSVCGGLHRMNAGYATGYGFTVANNKKEVNVGEFLATSETPFDDSRFDGYISFADGILINLETGVKQGIN